MRKLLQKKWVLTLLSGAVLLQTATSCIETSSAITSVATTVTAGSVLYLVFQVLNT